MCVVRARPGSNPARRTGSARAQKLHAKIQRRSPEVATEKLRAAFERMPLDLFESFEKLVEAALRSCRRQGRERSRSPKKPQRKPIK
jgi:hypothetical protein